MQHLEEGKRKVGRELVSIDGFFRGRAGFVEDEHPVKRNVPSSNKRPSDGSAFSGEVVDEHPHVAVVNDALVGEALGHSDSSPRCLVPNIFCPPNEEALEERILQNERFFLAHRVHLLGNGEEGEQH